MAGRIVIVAYRPHEGCESELETLVRSHVSVLRRRGLATEREPIIMTAQDGTMVEVFEWASAKAIETAHEDPEVTALWTRFARVCDFVPAGQLPELGELFSEFRPLASR